MYTWGPLNACIWTFSVGARCLAKIKVKKNKNKKTTKTIFSIYNFAKTEN
jgi:hypothetical protein